MAKINEMSLKRLGAQSTKIRIRKAKQQSAENPKMASHKTRSIGSSHFPLRKCVRFVRIHPDLQQRRSSLNFCHASQSADQSCIPIDWISVGIIFAKDPIAARCERGDPITFSTKPFMIITI